MYIHIPHIEVSLSHTQYNYLMHTNDFFTRAANRDNYSLIRKEVLGDSSSEGDVIADKPALLWRYGIKVSLFLCSQSVHRAKHPEDEVLVPSRPPRRDLALWPALPRALREAAGRGGSWPVGGR